MRLHGRKKRRNPRRLDRFSCGVGSGLGWFFWNANTIGKTDNPVDATPQTKASIYSWIVLLFRGIFLGYLLRFYWLLAYEIRHSLIEITKTVAVSRTSGETESRRCNFPPSLERAVMPAAKQRPAVLPSRPSFAPKAK